MIWIDRLALFSLLDLAALSVLVLVWLGLGWRIEHPATGQPSVSALMAGYRRDWMRQMVTRQPRMFDVQTVGMLRQGSAFFASACMIALGGGLALVGNTERLAGVTRDLTLDDAPEVVLELKLIVVLLFLSNAFLKFVWAHRLFGYCAVTMAAVPNEPENPLAYPRAAQAADLSITAARSFTRAMRAIYFGLAASAWLAGPVVLIVAVLLTGAVLYRREFASQSRKILLRLPTDQEDPTPTGAADQTR